MILKLVRVAALGIWFVAPALAQESPYVGLETRDIKALSQQQIDGYLSGQGMGLALPGELNGYPGPKHVLELADELQLTESQRAEVIQSFESMQKKAISLGKRVVAAETSLDRLFGDGNADSQRLREITSEIGLLQGQLRAAHLQAHLETRALLSADQVQKYVQLRGYDGSGHSHTGHHGHRH